MIREPPLARTSRRPNFARRITTGLHTAAPQALRLVILLRSAVCGYFCGVTTPTVVILSYHGRIPKEIDNSHSFSMLVLGFLPNPLVGDGIRTVPRAGIALIYLIARAIDRLRQSCQTKKALILIFFNQKSVSEPSSHCPMEAYRSFFHVLTFGLSLSVRKKSCRQARDSASSTPAVTLGR